MKIYLSKEEEISILDAKVELEMLLEKSYLNLRENDMKKFLGIYLL